MMNLKNITELCNRISLSVLGHQLNIRVSTDARYPQSNRVFIQILYTSPCSKSQEMMQWSGRKWYLSEFMTEDEVVKTIYAAFEACVKHEVMEGFKIDNTTLFNPHVDYTELLKISGREVKRIEIPRPTLQDADF